MFHDYLADKYAGIDRRNLSYAYGETFEATQLASGKEDGLMGPAEARMWKSRVTDLAATIGLDDMALGRDKVGFSHFVTTTINQNHTPGKYNYSLNK